jgi:SAM-dependent methyltransferase
MLCAARAKAKVKGFKVKLVQDDMRSFDLGWRFALVILSCNSLAHLTSYEDVAACLSQITRHLTAGGVFAFDIVNPSIGDLAPSEAPTLRSSFGCNQSAVAGRKELIAYDPVQQVQIMRLFVQEPMEEARIIEPMRLRIFFPLQVPLLLALAGLELAARYEDFDGNHLTGCSLNQVCIARRLQGRNVFERSPAEIKSLEFLLSRLRISAPASAGPR